MTGRDIVAGDFLDSIHRYARTLDSLGVGRGDVVALLAPNHPDALALRYAAHLIGAGATFLSIPSALEDRAELIRAVDPKLLVVFPETHSFVPPGIAVPLVGVGLGSGDRLRLNEAAAAPVTRSGRLPRATAGPRRDQSLPAAVPACLKGAGEASPVTPNW